MSQAVMGDFPTRQDAERALLDLRAAGVDPGDISVLMQEHEQGRRDPQEEADVPAGAFTGALTGAILGGLIGWILSLGVFDRLAVARFATENAVGATLAGALLGAVLLGLLGAIAGLTFGQPEASAPQHSETDPVDFLVTVRSDTVPVDTIREVLDRHHAINVQATGVPAHAASEHGAAISAEPHGSSGGADAPTTAGDNAPEHPVVRSGQDVYTLDDEHIGEVVQILGDYFVVQRGPFKRDLYVRFEDLHGMRGDALQVNATRDEVDVKNWQEPPAHSSHQGQGPTRP